MENIYSSLSIKNIEIDNNVEDCIEKPGAEWYEPCYHRVTIEFQKDGKRETITEFLDSNSIKELCIKFGKRYPYHFG